MIFNSETRTEREISDLNKVLKETDIQQKMKEIFNKLPQSVLDAFFSSETYEHEFFCDKNVKKGEEFFKTLLQKIQIYVIIINEKGVGGK